LGCYPGHVPEAATELQLRYRFKQSRCCRYPPAHEGGLGLAAQGASRASGGGGERGGGGGSSSVACPAPPLLLRSPSQLLRSPSLRLATNFWFLVVYRTGDAEIGPAHPGAGGAGQVLVLLPATGTGGICGFSSGCVYSLDRYLPMCCICCVVCAFKRIAHRHQPPDRTAPRTTHRISHRPSARTFSAAAWAVQDTTSTQCTERAANLHALQAPHLPPFSKCFRADWGFELHFNRRFQVRAVASAEEYLRMYSVSVLYRV
jgi:hypothetical protein